MVSGDEAFVRNQLGSMMLYLSNKNTTVPIKEYQENGNDIEDSNELDSVDIENINSTDVDMDTLMIVSSYGSNISVLTSDGVNKSSIIESLQASLMPQTNIVHDPIIPTGIIRSSNDDGTYKFNDFLPLISCAFLVLCVGVFVFYRTCLNTCYIQNVRLRPKNRRTAANNSDNVEYLTTYTSAEETTKCVY